jgi:hypothetical protein
VTTGAASHQTKPECRVRLLSSAPYRRFAKRLPALVNRGTGRNSGRLGKGGTASLFVDGQPAGTGSVERTAAYLFSLDETSGVGSDSCSPVCDDYPAGTANAFTGTIKFLRVDLGDDSHDHLIDPTPS